MSMTVDERRVEVLREDREEWGILRIVKASSKYDRRRRWLVVEWCPPEYVGTDMEEWAYRVQNGWTPAGSKENLKEANMYFDGFRAGMIANNQRSKHGR